MSKENEHNFIAKTTRQGRESKDDDIRDLLLFRGFEEREEKMTILLFFQRIVRLNGNFPSPRIHWRFAYFQRDRVRVKRREKNSEKTDSQISSNKLHLLVLTGYRTSFPCILNSMYDTS